MSRHLRYEEYRALALLIHTRICQSPEWCNYGEPLPEDLERDGETAEERRELARKRLSWYRHCQHAVDAENIAARVRITKSGKLKVG